MKPLRDYITVKPMPRELSQTLIVIADRNREPNADALGIIQAVGPGKRDKKGNVRPLDVKPGDVIRFEEHRTYPQVNGLYVMQEQDVAGVVPQEQHIYRASQM